MRPYRPICRRGSDGYWNATAMCLALGERMNDHMENAATKESLTELSSGMGIPIPDLAVSNMGGLPGVTCTWVHPKVAYHLAQWLSPRFAVRVSEWIDELLTTGRVELQLEPDLKAVPGLRRAVHQTATQLLAALEYQEELETNLLLVDARADDHRSEAEALAKQKARAERAIELSVWLKHTWTFNGHGQNIGMQTMRALGVLRRQWVNGRRRTIESLIKRDELLPRGLPVTFKLAVDYRLMDRESHPNGDEFIGLWKWLTELDQELVGVDRVAFDLAG